jgi:hypothetical protein
MNKKLEEQIRLAATGNEIGRQGTMQEYHEGEQCFVVGDSIIRNVGIGQNNIMVSGFLELERSNFTDFWITEI